MTEYRGNDGNLSQMLRRWLHNPPQGPAAPIELYGVLCPEPGCFVMGCGQSEQEAEDRLAEHRRRCHS